MNNSVSAVILTKNEEENVKRCLNGLTWSAEIVVVDDYSTDRTLPVVTNWAKTAKIPMKIFKRHLDGNFALQRNFGLEKTSGNWIFFIDADEEVTPGLKKEIYSVVNNSPNQPFYSGFSVKRTDRFLGKYLRFGETAHLNFIRLAKRGTGIWQGKVHETWNINGKIGKLKNTLLHYPHRSVGEFLKEINAYTDIVAQYQIEQGRKVSFWQILLYPLGKFSFNYIILGGFLDSVPGLIMAMMMSFHSFLVRGKLWCLLNKKHD